MNTGGFFPDACGHLMESCPLTVGSPDLSLAGRGPSPFTYIGRSKVDQGISFPECIAVTVIRFQGPICTNWYFPLLYFRGSEMYHLPSFRFKDGAEI
jgi:hypothetical protein